MLAFTGVRGSEISRLEYDNRTGRQGLQWSDVGLEDVDKFAFTGSAAIRREVGKRAGERLIEVSLELGGKSPNIVFPDANLNNTINGVMKGIFAASGQTCLAGSRILVPEEIREEFIE